MVKFQPDGWHSVTPRIGSKFALRLEHFLEESDETFRVPDN